MGSQEPTPRRSWGGGPNDFYRFSLMRLPEEGGEGVLIEILDDEEEGTISLFAIDAEDATAMGLALIEAAELAKHANLRST